MLILNKNEIRSFVKFFLIFLIFFFNFQSLSKADDIRDFQIEGISVGDGLLKHFKKNVIKDGVPKNQPYSSDKFTYTDINPTDYEVYESLQFHFKKNFPILCRPTNNF